MKKITFFVPVLNEEKNIDRCLKSIRNQNYPQKNVEIFLADAGCIDNTIKKAKKYGVTYFFNKKKLSEYAYKTAIKKSKGDYFVFFAADNELPNKNWISRMIYPFKDTKIIASYTHIAVPKKTSLVNKYYSDLHVEPLSWFIYRETSNPKYFSNYYEVLNKYKNNILFKFDKKNFPLIATAQGLVVRKSKFNFINNLDGDDMLPVIKMIKNNKHLMYVSDAGIYHHHINNIMDYYNKYGERVRRTLLEENKGFFKRKKLYSLKRKFLLYLFMPYALSIIFPAIDSLILSIRSKNTYMLMHNIMVPILALSIFRQFFKKYVI